MNLAKRRIQGRFVSLGPFSLADARSVSMTKFSMLRSSLWAYL